ncbi:hypothetical protein [Flavilitoribacter nigricans]|uniref:Uncharacterized protein n=1 Tax=Flavilitoribacter nigricans (strain ATCC 23147 / DSM 23189 / NBRC 102662 / NCIMB 1420 / SS-2) TaxID=1122177 RepID=A0A2D0N8S3_FLAN2|nr:hypothetical protein [Flavilitoribacter nigricans]PHN04173.1 hypothetical protein CRP01_23555 [Flavilitoribacter nigricans DSM 23189 = NBRC 102662]
MTQEIDRITFELTVRAVHSGPDDVWMQGDLHVLINGHPPYSINDMVDPAALLRSLAAEGRYFLFSCTCGAPECGGWEQGIAVSHRDQLTEWKDIDKETSWRFKQQDIAEGLREVQTEVDFFKSFFRVKNIRFYAPDLEDRGSAT